MQQKRETGADEQDPRVRRTRKLLQDALVELMGDRSFESITVRDIAHTATVNHATFYRHYPDKYHLAQAVFAEAFDSMVSAGGSPNKPLPDADSPDFQKAWTVLFKYVADNARLYRTLFNESGNTAFIRGIRSHFASIVKERTETRIKQNAAIGALRGVVKRPKSELPYTLVANLLIGTIAWWLEEGQQYDSDQVIEWTRKLLRNGFGGLLRGFP
jgi:AcrR family transcriptional regulator